MKKRGGRDARSGQPHSERAGEALLDTGARAELYRALLDLTCSRCGTLIREGDLFTREAEPASRLPLVRCCRACVPFSPRGGLLDALFTTGDEAQPAHEAEGGRAKVMSRLGPALAARGKRGGEEGGGGAGA
ncbi:MAG: hypothetical protein LC795_14935 [Acidobacteria bacterium]|nr:hypothetical protein [Acidobacteriota bacterium]MCA1620572.1 hypothetical protein [Acidobacteriota bacterium]